MADPCDEEPCRSLLDSYWQEIAKAYARKADVQRICARLRFTSETIRNLILLWFGLLGLAILCSAHFLPPLSAFCNLFWIMLAVLSALIVSLMAFHWYLLGQLDMATNACFTQGLIVLRLLQQISAACPEECRPPAFVMNCSCE